MSPYPSSDRRLVVHYMVKRQTRASREQVLEVETVEFDPLVAAARRILAGETNLTHLIRYGPDKQAKKAIKYWILLNAIQRDAFGEVKTPRIVQQEEKIALRDFLPKVSSDHHYGLPIPAAPSNTASLFGCSFPDPSMNASKPVQDSNTLETAQSIPMPHR